MLRCVFWFACAMLWIINPVYSESFMGRKYQVFDGRNNASPAGLVIVLHGAGGTGRQIRKSSGFDALARKHGFVVLYPSAPSRLWNDGRFSVSHKPKIHARDDVKWVSELVNSFVLKGVVDKNRIYAIGHSNGGGMVRRIHCDAPELLAGIAIVATKILKSAKCTHPAPIATALFYGTKDKIAPHEGRNKVNSIFKNAGDTFSAQRSVDIWRRQNKCKKTARIFRYDPVKADKVRVEKYNYAACFSPLVYFEMIGGGHAYPGAKKSRNRASDRLIGPAIMDVNAGVEAIKLWGL